MLDQLPPILGENPDFLDAVERCSRLATINRPVLVIGERGTGKELFSSRLHYLSPRWNGPLVKVNCAALSETLLESELFGHEMGAFTGARRKRAGRFELADGGTLVLDEIANASMAVQEKVLRIIEYGEFERVGGTETLLVDVRIIGAANVDLPALVQQGDFRADLLDRLAFDVITIPPLRSRPDDILPLSSAFAVETARELGRDMFAGFSANAEQTLLSHNWPGNIRELKNVIERSVFHGVPGEDTITEIIIDPFANEWRLVDDSADVSGSIVGDEAPLSTVRFPIDFTDKVAAYEGELILQALQHARYVQKDAADVLGLGYHQFRRLMQKHGI